MSGLDAVVSGRIEYQSCKTWSYSARLNAAVASCSRAEPVGAVGAAAIAGGRLTAIVPRVSSRRSNRRVVVSRRALSNKVRREGQNVGLPRALPPKPFTCNDSCFKARYHVEGAMTMAGAYIVSTYSFTIRLVQKRGALVRRLSFMSCNQPRGIPSRSR